MGIIGNGWLMAVLKVRVFIQLLRYMNTYEQGGKLNRKLVPGHPPYVYMRCTLKHPTNTFRLSMPILASLPKIRKDATELMPIELSLICFNLGRRRL